MPPKHTEPPPHPVRVVDVDVPVLSWMLLYLKAFLGALPIAFLVAMLWLWWQSL